MHRSTLPASAIAAWVALASPARAADPTTADCLGANNSAIDLRNDHKLRAARAQLLVCAAASCPADIRKECLHRVDDVNAQIPTVIFEAKDGSGKDLSAVKVTVDGEVVAERLEGTSLSIDPGSHTFVFETAGQPTVQEQLVIQEGEKERHERIAFGQPVAAPAVPAATPAGSPSPASSSVASGSDTSSSGLGTQKILAIVAGGVGVVGLGVGVAVGAVALSQKSAAEDACPGSQCRTPEGVTKWSNAASTGNVSTVGFIIGGVGIAGAAVLWFTAPSGSAGSSTQVGFGPGAVQVKGTW